MLVALAVITGGVPVPIAAQASERAASQPSGETASQAFGETAAQAAGLFGARPGVLGVSLSPSGSKLAYIAPGGHSAELIYVVDLTAPSQPPKAIGTFDTPTSEILGCSWATDERLVCQAFFIESVDGLLLGFTRMFAISADGSDTRVLTARDSYRALGMQQDGGSIVALDVAGEPGSILMTRDWVRESSNGTLIANDREGLGVDRIDLASGARRVAEPPDADAVQYVADDTGRVRLKVRHPRNARGVLGGSWLYFARPAGSERWELLSHASGDAQTITGFTPVAVDSRLDVAYGFDELDGRQALYRVALDGSGRRELVLARKAVDVDSLIRVGRQQRVVGASYATERREISYIDPELRALAASLSQALPDKPLINIVDATADEGKLLMIAASDTDPGMVYLYDKQARTLGELIPLRSGLEGRAMAPMTPITFPASDGASVPGYLTLPPGRPDARGLPAIVLPHGGPSTRDEWGFDWLVQFLAARGYAVLQPNYRGSEGYGRNWLGENGFRAWRTAIGDVNDAGRWLVSEGIADPARLAIVGWSYGGYAALQSQVLDAELYQRWWRSPRSPTWSGSRPRMPVTRARPWSMPSSVTARTSPRAARRAMPRRSARPCCCSMARTT